MNPTNFRRI